MKKLIALLLALSMVFMFASCNNEDDGGDTTCTSHVDSDNNGKCDNCGADVTPTCTSHTDKNFDGKCDTCQTSVVDATAMSITEAVLKQIEESASFKIVLDVTEKVQSKFHEEYDEHYFVDYSEECKNCGAPKTASSSTCINIEEQYVDVVAKITITVSKSDVGILNAKIELNSSIKDAPDATAEPYSESVYLVDGKGYTYDYYHDIWYVNPTATEEVENVLAMVEAVLDGVEPTEAEITALKVAAAQLFDAAFDVNGTKTEVILNGAEAIKDLQAYVAGITDATTLEVVINDALALVDEELTVDKILDKAVELSALTVNEALTKMDEWLTAEYNTTLQGIYDKVVNDARVEVLLKNFMTVVYGMQGTDLNEAVAETLAEMKAFKLADAIPADAKAMTLYDVLLSMTMGGGSNSEDIPQTEGGAEPMSETEDEVPTAAELKEKLKTRYLATPVAQMIPEFATFKSAIAAANVTTANTGLTVNYANDWTVTGITFTESLDFAWSHASFEATGTTDFIDIEMTASMVVSDISKNKVTITAPTGEMYVDYTDILENYNIIFNNDLYGEIYDVNVWRGSSGSGDDEVMTISARLYMTGPISSMEIGANAPLGATLANSITFNIYGTYSDGSYTSVNGGATCTITFDHAAKTATVVINGATSAD